MNKKKRIRELEVHSVRFTIHIYGAPEMKMRKKNGEKKLKNKRKTTRTGACQSLDRKQPLITQHNKFKKTHPIIHHCGISEYQE